MANELILLSRLLGLSGIEVNCKYTHIVVSDVVAGHMSRMLLADYGPSGSAGAWGINEGYVIIYIYNGR